VSVSRAFISQPIVITRRQLPIYDNILDFIINFIHRKNFDYRTVSDFYASPSSSVFSIKRKMDRTTKNLVTSP